MPDQEIHVIGYDDFVLLLGLLGIEGTILDNPENFLNEFNKLITNPSIGMIIVAIELQTEVIDYLVDFKLNNRKPFVYYLPDIFQLDVEEDNVFLNKINESISKIIH